MVEILIDRATDWDIPRLLTLRSYLLSNGPAHYAARNQGDEQRWRSAYQEWLKYRLTDNETVRVAVARQSTTNQAMGCAIGIVNQRVPGVHCSNGRVGWIQTVVIDPAWRGQGLGRTLIHFLLEWFSELGIEEVTLETTPSARRLYSSFGFEPSGEELLYYHPRLRGTS
ncbi:GNAT family N-acetyltransferase [Halomonas janggokensis]|uniref:GNAT family N-acetyltransferase n=1 Tax=Vreelandella janggokensis TaxID=370767 RepID=A0ABT4IRS3_9GAMM|nr:GNAT family N-acetyltransferase [Halomonas janggokensis]MCZ0925861.1 GNAT family N-acetyltransferase [Halomonas janggokensis]MCZ0930928.1 GNAT family N-acetyltransferase [Halomonas janggokensis]